MTEPCPVCQVQKESAQKEIPDHPHVERLTKEAILKRYPDRSSMAEAFAKVLWMENQ